MKSLLKNPRIAIFLVLLLIFFIGLMMTVAGKGVRDRYSTEGEPENAYMVNLMESGIYQEQLMCASAGKCVLLRTPGLHSFKYDYIEIEGIRFSASNNPGVDFKPVARGMYCPGRVSSMSCYEIIVTEPAQSCPTAVTVLGFEAPLYRETCLVAK